MKPTLLKVERGWAAVADWWAVIGRTKAETMQNFREAERRHIEIASRTDKDDRQLEA